MKQNGKENINSKKKGKDKMVMNSQKGKTSNDYHALSCCINIALIDKKPKGKILTTSCDVASCTGKKSSIVLETYGSYLYMYIYPAI